MLSEQRAAAVAEALEDLKGMTLTVFDGDFPREVLSEENLSFASFDMPADRNGFQAYDARRLGPRPEWELDGTRVFGANGESEPAGDEGAPAEAGGGEGGGCALNSSGRSGAPLLGVFLLLAAIARRRCHPLS